MTMTAEATAVKEITLTFNKAVADTTAVKVTVKKGNSTPTFTTNWSDDKKVATLAMDSKLTKGTYDITVSGADKSDLTASVTVEDQKLTTFELLSTNLVADNIPVSYGSISFKALDQYGKQMKVSSVTVTSSFGTLVDQNGSALKDSQISSVSADGSTSAKFAVTPALAILGTKGNITIVDTSGVTLTSEITLVAPANPSKAENLGLYNVSKSKYMDMTAGDKVADYQLVLKLFDQYGTEIAPGDIITNDEAKKAMQITVSAGTTGLNSGLVDTAQMDVAEIDGQKVFVVKFTSNEPEVKAGNIQITVVNSKVGLLDTLNFTVAPGTVIKSFSVAADNDIYAGEDVELSYSAIDADGNEVTTYDTLKKAFGSDTDVVSNYVTLKKQADGSAKLIFNMPKSNVPAANDFKGNMTQVLTFTVYPKESNIIVYNTTVKVNQAREIWEVTGVDSSKVIAANAGEELKFKPVDFKIADQYGNTMTQDQIRNAWSTGSISITNDADNVGWRGSGVNDVDGDITFTVGSDENAKYKVKAKDLGTHKDDGYVLTLSSVDTKKATDFAIEWKDSLNTFNVSGAALNLNGNEQFTVVGKVGGKKVTIPTSQYEIIAGGNQDKNSDGSKDRIKKTATLQVVVTDADHKSHIISSDYVYSNEDSKLTKIESGDNKVIADLDGLKIADLVQTADDKSAFKLKDQYGKLMSAPGELSATISIIKGDGYVKYDGTNKATVVQDGNATITEIVVTFTCGDLTQTETIKTS